MFSHCKGLPTGYSCFHIVRDYQQGGGVALYVNNDLDCSIISSKSTAKNDVFECVTIEVKLANCRHVVIAYTGHLGLTLCVTTWTSYLIKL